MHLESDHVILETFQLFPVLCVGLLVVHLFHLMLGTLLGQHPLNNRGVLNALNFYFLLFSSKNGEDLVVVGSLLSYLLVFVEESD